MEFYPLSSKSKTKKGCFNSQWDGILRRIMTQTELFTIVSIPNGMEFYSGNADELVTLFLFQFPMGWNSTLEIVRNIPKTKFQFPMGWNSTIAPKRTAAAAHFCFNSQWDGILPKYRKLLAGRIPAFQFPMGWNSTRCWWYCGRLAWVSIPNGMEFYARFLKDADRSVLSFNSQWDGILRLASLRGAPYPSVSIPNGMEFYAWQSRVCKL